MFIYYHYLVTTVIRSRELFTGLLLQDGLVYSAVMVIMLLLSHAFPAVLGKDMVRKL